MNSDSYSSLGRGAVSESASTTAVGHRGALATLLAALFGVTGLGSAAVAVVLPVIALDLELTAGRAALVVSCYSLALAVGSALDGRLGDHFGIRAPLVTGLGLMVTAAVLRAVMPALWPQVTHLTLSFAILAWSLAYALYLSLYAPVLLRKRVDGKPG